MPARGNGGRRQEQGPCGRTRLRQEEKVGGGQRWVAGGRLRASRQRSMGHAPPLRCDGSSRRRAAARAGAVRKDAAPARGKGRRRPKVGRRRAFGVVAAALHGPRAPLRCDGSGKRRAAARAGGVRKGVTATAGEKGGRPKVGRRRAFGVVAAANHGPRAPLRCDGSGKRRAAAKAGGRAEGRGSGKRKWWAAA